jgi:sterol 3beta-glucosyltransferase
MKLIAATDGTEGDVRPLATVCRDLTKARHEARLLADAVLGSAALGVPTTARKPATLRCERRLVIDR